MKVIRCYLGGGGGGFRKEEDDMYNIYKRSS